MTTPALIANIKAELERLEEDCIHSGKAQFNAGAGWSRLHYAIGLPMVMLSALAGTAFFKDLPEAAGVMTLTVAGLAALQTFLKPSEQAAKHKAAGDQYLALRNDARVYRRIALDLACDDQAAVDGLGGFTKRRNDLNAASPPPSDWDRRRARRGIEQGEATHQVDALT
jgi:hypothetical protein